MPAAPASRSARPQARSRASVPVPVPTHPTPNALRALPPGAGRIGALWALSCDARPLPTDSGLCVPEWSDALAHVLETAVDADECVVALTAVLRVMRSSTDEAARTYTLRDALVGVAGRWCGNSAVGDALARTLAAFTATDGGAGALLAGTGLAGAVLAVSRARTRAADVPRACAEAIANVVRAAAAAGVVYPCADYACALEALTEYDGTLRYAPVTAALAVMCNDARARGLPLEWLSARLRAYLVACIDLPRMATPGLVFDAATPTENAIDAVYAALHAPGARVDDWPVHSMCAAVWRTRGLLLLDGVMWRMLGAIIKRVDGTGAPADQADDDTAAAAIVIRGASSQGVAAAAAARAWTCAQCAATFVGCAAPRTSICAALPAGCGRVVCDACLARRGAPRPTCDGCSAPRTYTSCAPLVWALSGTDVRCPYCCVLRTPVRLYAHLRNMRCRPAPPPPP